jgi:nitroreductase
MSSQTIKELVERKSVRVFTGERIPQEQKKMILEAAVNAPSAGCQQLYTIIDIMDQGLKEKLSVLCDNQPFISKADLVLIFCADCCKWYEGFLETDCFPRAPGEGDLFLAVMDAAIAAQNAVTAAWSLGIGSCYIGDVMENCEEMRRTLNLPSYVFPAVMVVFGYPVKQQMERKKPKRAAMEFIVSENQYPLQTSEDRHRIFYCRNEMENMTSEEAAEVYREWMQAFCNRKYNSVFSKEMTRSVREYLKDFQDY